MDKTQLQWGPAESLRVDFGRPHSPSLSSSCTFKYRYSSPLPFLYSSMPWILLMRLVFPAPSSPRYIHLKRAVLILVWTRDTWWTSEGQLTGVSSAVSQLKTAEQLHHRADRLHSRLPSPKAEAILLKLVHPAINAVFQGTEWQSMMPWLQQVPHLQQPRLVCKVQRAPS